MKKILNGLFDYSEKIFFRSSFPLEGVIHRLSERVAKRKPIMFTTSDIAGGMLLGSVRKERVSLHRTSPFLGNMFKPYFHGRFAQTARGVFLEGTFKMHPMTRILISAIFLILVLAEIIMIPVALDQSQVTSSRQFLIGIPIIAVLLLISVFWGRFVAKNDIERISNEIKKILE